MQKVQGKVLKMEYNDIIHGKFYIPDYICTIIQTPHFQRLKNIKQMGLSYKVTPQVTSSRYEHCIGTYYLANKMLEAVEKNTKDLKIPDFCKRVVQIAALLHDVGHGPFSHTWEYVCCNQYHHEENASYCIDEIFKECLLDWNEDRPYAIELIKALIQGKQSCLRDKDKQYSFLFDILNNKRCDIDVDKWDYLQRDHHFAYDSNMPQVHLDFEDAFLKARASADRSRIEFRYCDFPKIYNIFEARTTFHIHIYQKPINICIENILKYVLFACENDLERIYGLKLKEVRSNHVDAFLQLDDNEVWRKLKLIKTPNEIVNLIRCLENPSLQEIHPQSEEEKLLVPNYLQTEIKIEFAGEKLHSENIPFYGNVEEKPSIVEKKGFHESKSYFQIIPYKYST